MKYATHCSNVICRLINSDSSRYLLFTCFSKHANIFKAHYIIVLNNFHRHNSHFMSIFVHVHQINFLNWNTTNIPVRITVILCHPQLDSSKRHDHPSTVTLPTKTPSRPSLSKIETSFYVSIISVSIIRLHAYLELPP